ncbi:MAG: UDP-N-acetylmuramoyl-L-alanyl-D-glutamate--2,6-diaminopimelate ligase [Chloroflexi bacterium]|nr:UDP-N-acetylmuramoyl-L-alanyl-D-glutamate--2,6-diaminopimelate ligase [Chloroflexota bacterium]MYC00629.1 UDP-N-acetylmuramoyl-L-alanyl-D-glutamate--2,6-diaminopimelate ligase [Chloroflexota bacterium]
MPQTPQHTPNLANSAQIAQILATTPHRLVQGEPSSTVSGVRQDSRQLNPGDLCVAVPGFTVDGHRYLESAIANGAAALVVQDDRRQFWQPIADAHPQLTVVSVNDTRAALPEIAAAYHDYPARKLSVVGVTGTDGKTTTTYLIHAMLTAAEHRTGLLNGVEFHAGGEWSRNETGETTPEADVIQAKLAEIVAAGDTHVVIEVSSHALELQRADQINTRVAVFTGLSDDHLDFHQTREKYLAAKLKLFESLDDHPEGRAVVGAEDEHRPTITGAHNGPTTIVTATPDTVADVSVIASARDARGSDVRVVTPAGALGARLSMPGDYNLGNAALAAGAAWSLGVGPVPMQAALNELRPVPGRMESIEEGQAFTVIVDAAATGPALDLALQTLKPHVAGRLILVFGVAGERDPIRKSSMAAAAARYADHTVITNENPRSEDPVEMVDEIAGHLVEAGGESFDKQPDRREAIRRAVSMAQPDDLVLIAGKGAEPTLIYADRVEPWDDREVARELLNSLPTTRLSQ